MMKKLLLIAASILALNIGYAKAAYTPPTPAQNHAAFNAMNYGALGTNTATTIGTTFSPNVTSLATFAALPGNSWMTNPAFGLTFSMTTSAAQGGVGTALVFTQAYTGINSTAATAAKYQMPTTGNFLVTPGMLVTGSCIAANTTVSSVNRTPGNGTITLSQNTSSACASGTSITFTIAPAQLQALTMDWYGIQSALAVAWAQTNGGEVSIPSGVYLINHSLINAGGNTDTSIQRPSLNVHGAGTGETQLQFTTDLGTDMCGMLDSTRSSPNTSTGSYYSLTQYHDFRIDAPGGWTRVNGAFPHGMDGLCVGGNTTTYNVRASGFHAGFNLVGDHHVFNNIGASYNGYGMYWAPYSGTMGNQYVTDSALAGNTISSVGIASTNQIDSSTFTNVHTGFSAYGFYKEGLTSDVTAELGFLSNTLLDNVFMEALGNGFIYDVGALTSVSGNTFVAGGGMNVLSNEYTISGRPVAYGIYTANFQYNTMIGTNWGDNANLTTAVIEVSGGWIANNIWINDPGIVLQQTTAVPSLAVINSGAVFNDTFEAGNMKGLWKQWAYSTAIPGEVSGEYGYNQVGTYNEGNPFTGIPATVANSFQYVAMITESTSITAIKADPTQVIGNGTCVFASTTNSGVYGGLNCDNAIGFTNGGGTSSGQTTVSIALSPWAHNGSAGSATGLTAAGTTQGTAYVLTSSNNIFSTVASGTGAIMAVVPVGNSIYVRNDGANALLVYPQSGGAINALSTNAGFSLAAGSSVILHRISSTGWRS